MFKTTALDSVANRFIDELGAVAGTRLEADDHNIWMDELVNAVLAAGLTLDITGANRDQVAEAIIALSAAGRNAIINGIGAINQRVTAFTLVKDEYCWDLSNLYGPDRHEGMATGTVVTAGSFGVTAAANVGVSGKAFKFSGVSLTGTGVLYHRYRMEAADAVKFKNQTVSIGMQVYHDVGSAIDYTIFVRKADVADNFAAVTAISDSGAQSIASATASDLSYLGVALGDCSNGIEIEIKIEAGAITTKNFELTEFQFEPGLVNTAFEYRSLVNELALCKRYYCKSYDLATAPGAATTNGVATWRSSGHTNADHTVRVSADFSVLMRSVPSIILYDPAGNTGKVGMIAGNNIAGFTGMISERALQAYGTNGAASTERLLQFHFAATSEL